MFYALPSMTQSEYVYVYKNASIGCFIHQYQQINIRFTYAKCLRLDFGKDGYSMISVPARSYWNTFKEEKGDQRGKLSKSCKCRGSIDTLIEIVGVHVFKYDLTRNNCQHFAEMIWGEMIMPKRQTVDM